MYATLLVCSLLLLVACVCAQNFSYLDFSEEDDGRVVGGATTSINEHPYQVSLRYKGRHTCGGAIISNEWIITAAHCVKSKPSDLLSIKAGSTTLHGFSGQVAGIKDVIVHRRYSPRSSDCDIALLQLEESLTFGSKVRSIELSSASDASGDALVVGWGVLEPDGNISNELREVPVPLVSHSECSRLYSERPITRRMICAGYVGEGGKDACQGDSGGPLVQNSQLIGIVSWGISCAEPYYPGVYTKIAAFRSWIADNSGV